MMRHAIDETLQRLHDEWAAGGGEIDDATAERIADALRPARRRRLERESAQSAQREPHDGA